jgi:anti-anti-sigma factor
MRPEQGTVLRLQGELDEDGCAAVRRQLAPKLASGLRHVVLDLTEVTDIGKDGLQMLRSLDRFLRRQRGSLLVLQPSAEVRASLRVNELEHLLQVRDLEVARPRSSQPAPTTTGHRAGVVPLVRRA